MEAKYNLKSDNKEGNTTIAWMPHGRNIVVGNDEANNAEAKRLASVGLIDPSTLSDDDRIRFGGVSKAAAVANTDSENQKAFLVVAVGPDVSHVSVGDRILLGGKAQGYSIEVNGKYYLQYGEFDVLGKFL